MPNAYAIGLGKSGVAAARLLHQQGWQVCVSDRGQSDSLKPIQQELEAEGISVYLGQSFEPDPSRMERIVASPGVPWDLPALVKARELGIETMGEMELAWRSLPPCPWIGITGTNGKTTVTSLIAAIFEAAGMRSSACGNIGYAACDLARTTEDSNPLEWVIAEISSYQIEASSTLAPKIGIWTTFTADHLNRHKTLDHYFDIKAQLLNRSDIQILNGDDPHLREVGPQHWPNAYWTSVTGKDGFVNDSAQKDRVGAYIESDWVYWGDEKIVAVDALKMVGSHNQQNLLMAVAAARLAGIEKEAIAQAIATFSGVPHRLEHICTWNGVDFINDSKATNYDAAAVGLKAVPLPVVLIAGGAAKKGDDTAWIQAIKSKVSTVLLIGDAAAAFAQRLVESNYTAFELVNTLDAAIPRAATLASQQGAKVVLLSPACASFDQYANFEARGDDFRQICLTYFGPGESAE
ncbi:MAG: UDP-N-acetylmuramoyl-L-alanine--D-glutamate ligase [Symploca sp. SIO2B6]|nr:UDP-N-acetylmuramoyl-L-alanine--D-glutamate ligase [Symploca sp. SIO2B6]